MEKSEEGLLQNANSMPREAGAERLAKCQGALPKLASDFPRSQTDMHLATSIIAHGKQSPE